MEILGYKVDEWLIIVTILLGVADWLCARFNLTKGAKVVDEIQDFITANKHSLDAVKGDLSRAYPVAESLASRIKGVTADDVAPLITKAAFGMDGKISKVGVTISADADGNVKIDPSGLVNKSAYKVGKFLKKVF